MATVSLSPFSRVRNTLQSLLSFRLKGINQTILITLLTVIITSIIVLVLWSNQQAYRPLYGEQEHINSSQIIAVLEASGVDYKISPESGQILVPEDKVGAARMLLAAKGVKAALPIGMAALDHLTLGTSQFLERAKYINSLEGEMARTIMSLSMVEEARVHLAIPKQTLFIRNKPELPSASVFLQLAANTQLDPQQVTAIANLVAGSVTNLLPKNIQIVDQNGNYLTPELSQMNDLSQSGNKQFKYIQELERNLVARVASLLTPIVGANNFKVQISPKVNFDQVEETLEQVDPTSVVASKNMQSDKSFTTAASGVPGSLRKMPIKNKSKNNDGTLHTQENIQYQVGHSIKHVKYQQTQLQQLSVSVLLNTLSKKKPWTEAQLNNISELVKNSIGFSAKRGDQFSLTSFDFVVPAKIDIPQLSWWQSMTFSPYLRLLISGILGLLLIIFAVIPLVRQLIASSATQQRLEQDTNAVDVSTEQPLTVFEDDNLPSTNQPFETKKRHLESLAKADPAKVAEVIGELINKKGK